MSIDTVRGYRNKNPGNIERVEGTRWQGMADDQSADERFVVFKAHKWGIRAIARILITYQDKRRAKDDSQIDSVQEIVSRWAPANENHTDAYAQFVARRLQMAADDETLDVYDFDTMKGLVKAIIHFELGAQPYDDKTLNTGLRLAGIEVPSPTYSEDKTVQAGSVAAGTTGIGLILEQVDSAIQYLGPLADHSEWVQYGLFAITMAAIGVIVWYRIDAANNEDT